MVHEIDRILKFKCILTWQADLTSTPKCLNFWQYKFEHRFEEFYNILDGKLLQSFINFIMCNNHLLIEKGSWQGIPRHHRVCNICNSNKLADEFHYLLKCEYFGDNRSIVINKSLCINPNMYTFRKIINSTNKQAFTSLSKLISAVLKKCKETTW